MIRFLLAFAMTLFAVPAAAQTSADFASGCADDRGSDRCSDKAVRAWQQRFDLTPIERMAGDGATVRRILYVDGYGREMLAISAIRAKGRPPVIEVRRPRFQKEGPFVRDRPVSEAVWQQIMGSAAMAHRRLEPEANDGGHICLHSWVSRFEAADPRRLAPNVLGELWLPSRVQTATASTCGGNPTTEFAFTLASVALDSFAECSAVGTAGQRNAVTRLQSCLGFSGDTFAAAHAAAAAQDLHLFLFRNRAAANWAELLRRDTTLVSNELRKKNANWQGLEAIAVASDHLSFHAEAVDGIDSQHARMTGVIRWRPSNAAAAGGNADAPTRRVALMWVEQAGDWVIDDIGPLD
jgi:hypothetical protein